MDITKTQKKKVGVIQIIVVVVIFFAISLITSSAFCATYYVDKDSIGGICNDTKNGTITSPWCTIDKANKTLTAGDTVYIRAATYYIGNQVGDGGSVNSQGIAPEHSGTSGNVITYSAYPGEVVNFEGISDGDRIRNRGIELEGKSYIHITGVSGYNMKFTKMTFNLTIGKNYAGYYNEIDHCDFGTFYPGSEYDYHGIKIGHGAQYNHIHDNNIHDWQTYTKEWDGPVCMEVGEEEVDSSTYYNVIENNVMYHCGHHVIGLQGMYNVFRNNFVHNENYWEKEGVLYGYRNFLSNGGVSTTGYHIIEGNKFGQSGVSLLSATTGQRGGTSFYLNSSYNIIRYNDLYGALGMAMNANSYGGDVSYNSIYNNTFYSSGYGTEDDLECDERFPLHFTHDDPRIVNNKIKNNLFLANWPQTTTTGDLLEYGSGCSVYTRPVVIPIFAGDLQIIGSNHGITGSDVSGYFVNPDISDPYVAPNLSLISTSAAKDAASYLTQASNSGSSSTTLIVDDARYFQDGNFSTGIPLSWSSSVSMSADWIAIGTVSNVVQIKSIDYSTNTITLTSPMSWENGAKIWLYKKSDGVQVLYGSAPDMGAHEYAADASSSTTVTSLTTVTNKITNYYSKARKRR